MKTACSSFQGMWQIVRFNPWFYALALLMVMAGALLQPWRWWPGRIGVMLVTGYGVGCWWTLASLAVSHWVYDRSDWRRGGWVRELAWQKPPHRVLNVHAGFDETTERLQAWLSGVEIQSLSLFDPERLTESSIHRAAAYRPSPASEWKGSPEYWPLDDKRFDWVLFLLSAHEFRRHEERACLLTRAREALQKGPNATVVLAEHARDAANFLAFGPGFVHFHSPASWRKAWEAAGLTLQRAFRVTPFLRVWILVPKTV